MNYLESLDFLFSKLPMYQRVGAPALKYNLDNTFRLLALFDNPQNNIKTIHIAGTNGKGSSAHGIASILTASGYKTGLFTSPHLKSFNERIRINGIELDEDYVAFFITKVKELIIEIEPSFFEITFCMAMSYFHAANVDIAVIETGLGGRLDSTNVLVPEISLITSIGLDHTELLGDTIEKIAKEKAGIIKSKVPVVIGSNQPEILPIFISKANDVDSTIYHASEIMMTSQVNKNKETEINIYIKGELRISNLILDIKADYFKKNLSGVLKVIELLIEVGWVISDRSIKEGLSNVKKLSGLKGRFQILSKSPLVVADISHNLDGARVLLDQIGNTKYENLYIIFGAVKDKHIDEILDVMSEINAKWFFSQATVPRALSATELQKIALEKGIEGIICIEVNEAIEAALTLANKEDLILICGSTFLVAEINNL